MRPVHLALVASLAVLLASGCDLSDQPIEQTVRGSLLSSEADPAPLRIKVLSWSEVGCAGPGPESVLDQDGVFSLKRIAYRGQLAVVVQHDTLCALIDGAWVPVWDSGHYGPAPGQLEITCRNERGRWSCTVVGDGVAF